MSEQVSFVVEHYDNEALAEANEQLGLVVARLYAENAKLRELMSELWPIACSGSCVDKCAHYDECLPHYEEDGCMLKARMAELGVEV
jgi:hypothetical protein